MAVYTPWSSARVLLVDDLSSDVLLLETILAGEGFRDVVSITDPRRALDVFRAFSPDLVLLDLLMPHKSGLEVLHELKEEAGDGYLPILVLTADTSSETKARALSMGARDFLTKPFDPVEVRLRIKNLLETRRLYLELNEQNEQLEQKVAERTAELEVAKIEILERLALTAELRDDETGLHTQRVGRMSAHVAQAMHLPDATVELVRRASPLHDIGKIATPDSILLKPGKLSDQEWRIMKRHTQVGAQLLANSVSANLQLAKAVALTHHERWDGGGYWGLAGDEIPMCSRVVAVADVFDALTHRRPYKEAWPADRAIEEISAQRGRQFDPRAVDALLEVNDAHDLLDPPEMPNHTVVDLSAATIVAEEADMLREAFPTNR